MNQERSNRSRRKGKVAQLHKQDPLLTRLGYETLIGMVTPEEMQDAQELVDKFLKGCKSLDIEKKVVFAYLFGVMQGENSMYDERAGKTLAERLMNVHRMGQRLGMTQAILLFEEGKNN